MWRVRYRPNNTFKKWSDHNLKLLMQKCVNVARAPNPVWQWLSVRAQKRLPWLSTKCLYSIPCSPLFICFRMLHLRIQNVPNCEIFQVPAWDTGEKSMCGFTWQISNDRYMKHGLFNILQEKRIPSPFSYNIQILFQE